MQLFRFFILLVCVATLTQSCSLKARIKRADKKYQAGEYYTAGELYKRVYGQIPGNEKQLRARVAFSQGECYSLTSKNSRAEQAYANALRNAYPDSIVFLKYAQVLHRQGKYADALKYYKLCQHKDSTGRLVQNGIEACQNVANWRSQPTRHIVRRADLFNARATDNFSPAFLNQDGDVLLFTSS
ncbi:MAG TPA: hypothetical protein VK152_02095, partial [Paludibacter sp.]|nr:hypothetical protein [Paludibacter sp.]